MPFNGFGRGVSNDRPRRSSVDSGSPERFNLHPCHGDPETRVSESTDRRIVLAAGLRLPQARAGGVYGREDVAHLGAALARELLARTELDPALLDEVIVGCVGPPHDQANVGRVVALRAGIPRSVPAYTVGRNCASGMQAVTSAVASIRAGEGTTYLCMGVEVMSAYPLIFNRKAVGFFTRLMKARSLPARLAAFASFRPAMMAPRITLKSVKETINTTKITSSTLKFKIPLPFSGWLSGPCERPHPA